MRLSINTVLSVKSERKLAKASANQSDALAQAPSCINIKARGDKYYIHLIKKATDK